MVASGVATIVVSSGVGLVVVFFLWHRVPPVAAFALMGSCGIGVATGGLLVQEDVGAASWVVALLVLVVLTPVHARLVFGRPGRRDVVAAGPAAA
jgi:hypothetical protein